MLEISQNVLNPFGYAAVQYLSPFSMAIDQQGHGHNIESLGDIDFYRGYQITLDDGSCFTGGEDVLLYTEKGPIAFKDLKGCEYIYEVGTIYFKIEEQDVPPYWIGATLHNGDITVDPPEVYVPSREMWSRMTAFNNPQHQILYGSQQGTNMPYEVYTFDSDDIEGKSEAYLDFTNAWTSIDFPSIPLQYQYSVYIDRLNLIRGMFDAAGFVNPLTGAAYLSLQDYGLIKTICFVIRSLGGDYCLRQYNGCYELEIYLANNESPFSIGAKGDLWKPTVKVRSKRKVIDICPVTASMREIKVQSLVLDNFVTLGLV